MWLIDWLTISEHETWDLRALKPDYFLLKVIFDSVIPEIVQRWRAETGEKFRFNFVSLARNLINLSAASNRNDMLEECPAITRGISPAHSEQQNWVYLIK